LLQRSAFQDLHIAAVLAGHRYERVGEPIPRIVDIDWIVAEVARNLSPGRIKGRPVGAPSVETLMLLREKNSSDGPWRVELQTRWLTAQSDLQICSRRAAAGPAGQAFQRFPFVRNVEPGPSVNDSTLRALGGIPSGNRKRRKPVWPRRCSRRARGAQGRLARFAGVHDHSSVRRAWADERYGGDSAGCHGALRGTTRAKAEGCATYAIGREFFVRLAAR
jgi:hypothetical protein